MDAAEAKAWPPSKYAYEQLSKAGEIGYGICISWERIEDLFGMKREGELEWRFRSEWIALTGIVKMEGFIFTERGQENGVRILTREEMADIVKAKELQKSNDSLRNSLMLSKVPREGMGESEIRKLDHWEEKTAVVGATSKVLLRKRNLPSPEMAIKSLRQISDADTK